MYLMMLEASLLRHRCDRLSNLPKSKLIRQSVFATDSPQAQKAHGGQWRISVDLRGWNFVAKTTKTVQFQIKKGN
ncbi:MULTISPECIES: hypothetical protein [Pseudomonas]|uniref:hypothetical protein n=1 Tax=Pseudomonas sp. BF-RE-29 TaxID=2832378 RepID=UPI001CBAA5C4|nr:hypothetical protein [Pseudomonas sp. BF-RE-29]